jgi:rare lipoprotein A
MMTRIKLWARFAGLFLLTGQSLSCAGSPAGKSPVASGPAIPVMIGKREHGIASVYTDHRTASGERFSARALTAAHRTLPFGSCVKVTSPRTGRSVVVRINDRGPFVKGRIIDLSPAAAASLGLTKKMGITKVEVAHLH